MRRRAGEHPRMTARELVDAVDYSDVRSDPDPDALQRFLTDLGYDPVQYVRARYWLRHGQPVGYYWDEPSRPVHGLRRRR